MKKVTKAIIPAAGLGTRFLPATKTIPKEMLPIVDKPTILYVVEEAVRAGIEDIILISGRGKSAIEDFFDNSYEVEDILTKAGKTDLLERLEKAKGLANIISIRQKEALGLGHAVLCGQPIIGDEPFAVLLADEIMIGTPTVTEELANQFNITGISTIGLMEVQRKEVVKYGMVKAKPLENNLQHNKPNGKLFDISDVVEKPSEKDTPSTLAIPGRYVFENALFNELRNLKPGKNGEIQLTDAMTKLAIKGRMHGMTFSAKRYDAGDKLGFLTANIELGLIHPETGEGLRQYIKTLAQRL
ncbi:MAG: UTP--glucose-1-phosphate uridylyltransferase GalU [Bdellovibrionota bacterium]